MEIVKKLLLKTALLIVLCLLCSVSAFAADSQNVYNGSNMSPHSSTTNNGQLSNNIIENDIIDINCNDYEECIEKYNSLNRVQKESVSMVYYSNSNKDVRYTLFNDIYMKLSSDSCPPIINFYKRVNTVNYMLDVYKRYENSTCIGYYVNVNGDGLNRNSVIGQLEVIFCEEDNVEALCDHAVIMVKKNYFAKKSRD